MMSTAPASPRTPQGDVDELIYGEEDYHESER